MEEVPIPNKKWVSQIQNSSQEYNENICGEFWNMNVCHENDFLLYKDS